ncbi:MULTISPECIES: hypothetical protein [Brasilonema]|nr:MULTISPECIES: hypothetical protein [Brasilonema]
MANATPYGYWVCAERTPYGVARASGGGDTPDAWLNPPAALVSPNQTGFL